MKILWISTKMLIFIKLHQKVIFDQKSTFDTEWSKVPKSHFSCQSVQNIEDIVENVRRMHFWQKMTKFGEEMHISPKSAKMTKKSKKLKRDGKVWKVDRWGPEVTFALKTNGGIDVLGAIFTQSQLLGEKS